MRIPLAVVVLLFVGLRAISLTADPPVRLVEHYEDFAHSVFDEGWWTAGARQQALFGKTLGTGFDLFWVSPVLHGIQSTAFRIGDVSLASARTASIALGAAAVCCLWLAGRPGSGARAARLAALLWAVSFAPAQLGRMALPETAGTALGLGGALALLRGGRAGPFAAGLLAALATLTKPHFAVLLVAFPAAAAVLAARRERRVAAAVMTAAAGAALPLTAWALFVLAHRDAAAAIGNFYLIDRWFVGIPADLSGAIAAVKPLVQVAVAGVVYRHQLFATLPGAFLLAAAAAPAVVCALLRPRSSRVPEGVIVFGLWALAGGAAMALLPFQPLRYHLPLVPALLYLASWALLGEEAGPGERAVRWGAGLLVTVQALFAALQAWLPDLAAARSAGRVALLQPVDFSLTAFLARVASERSLEPFSALPREIAFTAAMALCGVLALAAGGLIAAVAGRALSRGLIFLAALGRRRGVILTAMLLFQAGQWLQWLPTRAHTLPAMGRTLDELLPADAVVSPLGTYSLESRLRYDSAAVLAGGMFDASGGADYFVALASHPRIGVLPEGEIERRYPGSRRIHAFHLTGEYVYHLYRAAGDAP